MKFRTMLLASAAVMFTSSAFAADITNPFFLPTQGKFLSDTSVEFSRVKWEGEYGGASKDLYAREQLAFGITDNLAVFGAIGNTFDYDKGVDGAETLNNDHNFDYELGVAYNHNFGKVLTQVGASYYTYDPQSFYGQNWGVDDEDGDDRWEKQINAHVMLGYAMDCGLTPYTSFSVNADIDEDNNEQRYSWFVGAHKKWEKVAVDGGFRYEFGDDEWEGNNENLYVQASANYFVKENFTLGVYGDYNLMPEDKDTKYDYTVGLNAKVLF